MSAFAATRDTYTYICNCSARQRSRLHLLWRPSHMLYDACVYKGSKLLPVRPTMGTA